jgi:hypothetical protein
MKKLLILMLVLGLASVASAGLQISVGGVQEPIDSQINICPSDHLVLDIWTDARIAPGIGEVAGYALVCQSADASISGGISLYPEDPGITIGDGAAGVGFPVAQGEDGVWGMIALAVIPEIPAGATIFDLIDFHCEWGPNDVVVKLYSTADWVNANLEDSVIIHQVPEPASMLLLGLGGLLLRRRK